MTSTQINARHRSVNLPSNELRARVQVMPFPAILGGPGTGRWTILAAQPRFVIQSATGLGGTVCSEQTESSFLDDALDHLALLLNQHGLNGSSNDLDPDLPFLGGMIGFLSYDLAPRIEVVPRRLGAASSIPALQFGLYDTFVLIDHDRDQANLWAVDLLDEGDRAIGDRLDAWSNQLNRDLTRRFHSQLQTPIQPDQTRTQYLKTIDQAKRYIEAGDIFQVNLAQRFAVTSAVDPIALDARLQASSPAPYSAYLSWGSTAILSQSPELFYETRGRSILTRPIKGTRPRSADPVLDQAMAAELIASAKDEAELTMIVDLERNDLGRVCEFGSVQVTDPRSVQSYQNVHHTEATIAGRLRGDAGPIDVVRALFPGGSITGAPKIRAMEIIDELEPCRRGIYTGSIGYWSANGRSAFNIAIRTVVIDGHQISYHVGGGIVADSDPEAEYQETLDKGRALFSTLNRLGEEG